MGSLRPKKRRYKRAILRALKRALRQEVEVKLTVIKVLQQIGVRGAERLLRRAQKDREEIVREAAKKALRALKSRFPR